MQLTGMGDIGGLRVVVESRSDLAALNRVATDLWGPFLKRTRDYVENPQSTGYRAIHLEPRMDGRRVEIQLRTSLQHRWAATVEWHERMGHAGVKSGKGDPQLVAKLRQLADAYAIQETS